MCSFITTLWLASFGRWRDVLQTGMGAHPQLLSSLYVSFKAWPSSLMSVLMTSWSRASAECSSLAAYQGGAARSCPGRLGELWPSLIVFSQMGFEGHSVFFCLHPLRISAVVPALAELCRCEGAQDGCLLPLLCSWGLASNSQGWGCAGSDHTLLSHQVTARDLFLPPERFSCSTLS